MTVSFADISDAYIDKFVETIRDHYSVDFSGYNFSFLRRRIASRMNRIDIFTVEEYYQYLIKSSEELSQLIQNLTINTSEFMRNPEVFKIIATDILPYLMANVSQRQLRFWSAGCSGGQEAYSLAIILTKMGCSNVKKAVIIATDIDDFALQKAREGIYKEQYLKNLSERDRKISFFKAHNECYEVREKIKDLIYFRNHNLITGQDLGMFDMIMCRNVSIYFSKQLQQRMYERFLNNLADGGYLIMGKSEMISLKYRDCFKPVSLEHRIYRKVS